MDVVSCAPAVGVQFVDIRAFLIEDEYQTEQSLSDYKCVSVPGLQFKGFSVSNSIGGWFQYAQCDSLQLTIIPVGSLY